MRWCLAVYFSTQTQMTSNPIALNEQEDQWGEHDYELGNNRNYMKYINFQPSKAKAATTAFNIQLIKIISLQWRHNERDGVISVSIVCLTVCSGADQRTHQRSTSLAFLGESTDATVDFLHKGLMTRKMFSFYNAITWKIRSGRETVFHLV